MRQLITSYGVERIEAAKQWILAKDSNTEILILGPTRRAADDFVRTLVLPSQCRGGLTRSTIVQLAWSRAARTVAEMGCTPASELGANILAQRAIARARPHLRYFVPVLDTPGFPGALASTLTELRLEGVTADQLRAHLGDDHDLAHLLHAYERELAAGRVLDLADILRIASAARQTRIATVMLDPQAVQAREIAFLATLAHDDTLVTLHAGDTLRIARIAGALACSPQDVSAAFDAPPLQPDGVRGESRAGIRELGRGTGRGEPETDRNLSPGGLGAGTVLSNTQRRLFARSTPAEGAREGDAASRESASAERNAVGTAHDGSGTKVVLFSAPGEGRECIEIARAIDHRTREGLRYDQVAILLRDPVRYQSILEDALARAEIPAFFTRGTVRPDPSGRAFLALLECGLEHLSALRFSEYLSLGQVPVLDIAGAPALRAVPWVSPRDERQLSFMDLVPDPEAAAPTPLPVDDESPSTAGTLQTPRGWEALLVEAAVVEGGAERWKRRLRGLDAELTLWMHLLANDDALRKKVERDQRRLRELERFALPVVEALGSLPREVTWGEWLAPLRALATLSLRDPTHVLETLAELEVLRDLGPVGLEEVVSALRERLTLIRQETTERRFGRVFVGTLEEARGRVFEVVFVPGLAEGLFPKRLLEDPLFLDTARARVSEGLKTTRERATLERTLFHVALGATSRELIASFPRVETQEGKARVPSFYALELIRARDGAMPELRTFEEEARRHVEARLDWPAPKDPQAAIDDTEYDLAQVAPFLDRALTLTTPTPGASRFLMTVNEHLARSLRTRYARAKRTWTLGDGLVERSEQSRALMAPHRLSARPYSPTDLERFAVCPYQFFLRSILKLRPRESRAKLEAIDPRTRGALMHEVLYLAVNRIRAMEPSPQGTENPRVEHGAQAGPRLAPTGQAIFAIFEACLLEVKSRYADTLVPAIPRVFEQEVGEIRKDLFGLAHAMASEAIAWAPTYTELGLGDGWRPGALRDPASRDEAVVIADRFTVRGRIDLVERHRQLGSLRVTDYKTGKVRRIAEGASTDGGRLLQPLIYAMMLDKALGADVDRTGLFYSTRKGGYQRFDVAIGKRSLEAATNALEKIDLSLEQAFLPVAPDEGACTYCDYLAVCGPGERARTLGKAPDDLRMLVELRRLP